VAPETEGSLSCSQAPANSPYPEPTRSTPHTPANFLRFILIPSSHLCLGLLSGLFPSGFPTKALHTSLSSPMRATFSAHLVLLNLICLNDIWGWVQTYEAPHCETSLFSNTAYSIIICRNPFLNLSSLSITFFLCIITNMSSYRFTLLLCILILKGGLIMFLNHQS
jgi:hypothetical protein